MGGVQAHLESPLPRIRRLGMVTAEILATTLDPDGPKLKFEYEEDEESRLLWSLVKPPEDPGLDAVTEWVIVHLHKHLGVGPQCRNYICQEFWKAGDCGPRLNLLKIQD